VETIVMNEQLHQGQRTAGVIRFDRPASVWEEAYPIGNGKLGAMVFGDPRRERLALNEDSVWYAKGNALSGSAWGRACLYDRRSAWQDWKEWPPQSRKKTMYLSGDSGLSEASADAAYHIHPNLAGNWARQETTKIATQMLYWGGKYDSRIEFPI
jgi:hypothetical protein